MLKHSLNYLEILWRRVGFGKSEEKKCHQTEILSYTETPPSDGLRLHRILMLGLIRKRCPEDILGYIKIGLVGVQKNVIQSKQHK